MSSILYSTTGKSNKALTIPISNFRSTIGNQLPCKAKVSVSGEWTVALVTRWPL